MKQPDSLTKQLLVPGIGVVGLIYLAQKMVRDTYAQGGTMTTTMWISVGVMLLGAAFAAYTGWQRYRLYQVEQAELAAQAAAAEAEVAAAAPQKIAYSPDPDSDLAEAAGVFARLITGNRGLVPQFKKATYAKIFESYCCQVEEGLAHLRLHDGEPEALSCLAEMTLDRLEADWAENKFKTPDFTDQILISIYLVPALMYSREPVAEDFATTFHECWGTRYPKSVFRIGTYEAICQGFEKKFGCFITTAVCQSQGKADDCYELTSFRWFRDNWLASQPGGKAMIAEYYEVAPSIVNLIGLQSNAPDVYRQIRQKYLQPCLKDIEAGNNQSCLTRYKGMVEDLRRQYRV